MTVEFICRQLAKDFEIPCNFSPMDEIMFESGKCENDCGEIEEWECWRRYFETMKAKEKNTMIADDFRVKVNRYYETENFKSWDGWFYSKVYAIEGNKILVFDDGSGSSSLGEEGFCPAGFTWFDLSATMEDCITHERVPQIVPCETNKEKIRQ